jgi:hypothetical protein
MNSTLNYNSQNVSVFGFGGNKWTMSDFLIITTLVMYIFISVIPQGIGNCSQITKISAINIGK